LYTKERIAAIKQILSVKIECNLEELKIRPANEETDTSNFARITELSQVRSKGRAKHGTEDDGVKGSGSGWVQLRLFPLPPPEKPKGPKKK
jgi:hypothetical protein